MGQRFFITEEEQQHIKKLYEISSGLPYTSEVIESINPFKNPKYKDILDNRVIKKNGNIIKDLENPEIGMIFFEVNLDNMLKDRDILLNKLLKDSLNNKTVSIVDLNINPNKNLFKIFFPKEIKSTGFRGGDVSFLLEEITNNTTNKPIIIGYTFVYNHDYKTKKFSYTEGVSPAYVIIRNKDGQKENNIVRSDIISNVSNKIIEILNNNSDELHQYMGSWDDGFDKYFTIKKVTGVTKPDF